MNKILEGYITCIEHKIDIPDVETEYTIHVDRVLNAKHLHGVREVVSANFCRQSIVSDPRFRRHIQIGGTVEGEVKIRLPITNGLQPETLLGQKITLVNKKGKLEFIPFDQALYRRDPYIQAKNEEKAKKKAEAKILKQFDNLI